MFLVEGQWIEPAAFRSFSFEFGERQSPENPHLIKARAIRRQRTMRKLGWRRFSELNR